MIHLEHRHPSSDTTDAGHMPSSHVDVSTKLISPNIHDRSTSSTITNGNLPLTDNGNVFTLTNIYTFADHAHPHGPSNSNKTDASDRYRIKSFVEVFDSPSSQQHHYETRTSSIDTDSSRHSSVHCCESTNARLRHYTTGSRSPRSFSLIVSIKVLCLSI
jgi:hypothetical protein